jgi:hypothetical protein
VDQHGTDAAAPGRSDSGGRRTPHGRGGAWLRHWRRRARAARARPADRRGPVVAAGCGRERERAGQRGAGRWPVGRGYSARRRHWLTSGPERHNAGQRGFKPDSKIFQTDLKFSKL